MGLYFQPGNLSFQKISSSQTYIDRTGVIAEINKQLDQGNHLIMLSLPPGTGKTWQMQSLYAYYDESCDSRSLLEEKAIAKDTSFHKHLHKYLAIRLDMAVMMTQVQKGEDIRVYVEEALKKEALRLFTDFTLSPQWDINTILSQIVERTGKELFFFIDEWDAPIRMATDNLDAQRSYLDLLRSWFKNESFTESYVAAAYMTGILPIKKMKGEATLSDFKEYTILKPGFFAPYVGFHEDEVRSLCAGKIPFEEVKKWYDGYSIGDLRYYNPDAITGALVSGECGGFWPAASKAISLASLLSLGFDGLLADMEALAAGARLLIDTSSFQNDTVRFRSKEDVFTLLIHLGYLSYDRLTPGDMRNWTEKEKARRGSSFVFARMPNLALRKVFLDLLNQK